MNTYTFIRNGPMPKCAKCKKPMGWWNPYMAESDYECTHCTASRISDVLMKEVDRQLLNSEQEVQASVASKAEQGTNADNQKKQS